MQRVMWWFLCGVFCLAPCIANAQKAEEQYMAVFIQGKRVGYYKNVRKVVADSVVTTELMTFSVDAGQGMVEKLSIDETVETKDGQLVRFRHEAAQGERLFQIRGDRQGDQIHLVLTSQKEKHEKMMQWLDETHMVEGRRLLVKKMGLTQGTEYEYERLFTETLAMGMVKVSVGGKKEVEVLGKTMELTETQELVSLQQRAVQYLVYRDETTKPIKIVVPSMYMEMVDCSKDYAMTPPGTVIKE